MKLYKKKFKYFKNDTFLDKLFNSFLMIIIINWFFQGTRGMQYKELIFRIFIEITLIIFFYKIIEITLLFSIVISHTIFWIFFCQFWLVLRYFPFYTNNLHSMNVTCKKIIKKIKEFQYLNEAVIIGSLSKEKKISNVNSDLDLRIFFPEKIKSFFIINFFLNYLRLYSFLEKFPLDIYSYDNFDVLKKIDKKDKIFIVKDKKKKLIKYLKQNENKL